MDEYAVGTSIKLGVEYGIKGLKRYDQENHDEWLDMFGGMAEELTLKGYSPDSEPVEQLEEFHQYAKEIRSTPVKERPQEFPEEQVEEIIEEAEEFYDKLV